MRIRYPLKKPARVARRENFGDFKGVFKAKWGGGYPLENRRAKRAAKFLGFLLTKYREKCRRQTRILTVNSMQDHEDDSGTRTTTLRCLGHVRRQRNMLQFGGTHRNTLEHGGPRRNTQEHIRTWRNTQEYIRTRRDTL